ncbi:MAG: transporter substrate-binding domain-containing protein [Opitutales bacterium]
MQTLLPLRRFMTLLLLPGAALFQAASLSAQTEGNTAAWTVGVTDSPPFSYQDEDGAWTGMTFALWDAIAADLGIAYELKPYSLPGLLEAVKTGEAEVAAAALVTTAEREQFMDFSHSFYASGLSIATEQEGGFPWGLFFRRIFSWPFWAALFSLSVLLCAVGFAIWLVERKKNPEQFGGDTLKGIGSGFWWSAVTMTTVGYGDKAPVTPAGRLVGLVWMFASIIIISGFTGAIASSLTLTSMTPKITGKDDLYRASVGVIEGSSAARRLDAEGIRARTFASTRAGLQAVADGRIEAFVNDAPVLRHFVGRDFPDTLTVLNETFNPGYYALGLRDGEPQLEAINLALLKHIRSAAWRETVARYQR